MSYFPRAARVLVVLAMSSAAIVVPSSAIAAEHRPAAHQVRPHAKHLTRHQRLAKLRAYRRAVAAKAARKRAAQARARAVKARNLKLRENKRLPHKASIVFDKNWKNPYNSRIVWHVWVKPHPGKQPRRWVEVEKASWRAGSGLSGAAGRDECHRGQGWSPNGIYSFVQHNRRKAPLINGRVFELQPMACRNGTVRQLMFIHSEQTWDNKQCKNTLGDDGCRWEVPTVNDYKSWGCIKMAPTDLKALTRHFHRYFKAETRYPTGVVRVKVKS
jgi:hypothetical protein